MRKIIKGNVNLNNLYLTELFDLSDVEVTGYFNCNDNDLTSLEGSPKTVRGNFHCHTNHLTSLAGCPETVGGNFNCCDNHLTSLAGCPETVGLNQDLLLRLIGLARKFWGRHLNFYQ